VHFEYKIHFVQKSFIFYQICSMKKFNIQTESYSISIGNLSDSSFDELLTSKYKNAKKIILVDENTKTHCLEYLLTEFSSLKNAEIIEIPAGEENKVLEICYQIWESLSEYQISRHDVMINLGGGVVSDLGGFVASIYKRGIDFINIPTSLLAMVDASVGGKTGVDLGSYKNQLGLFSNPVALYVDAGFLSSLPEEEQLSGYAEMLKHGLIKDKHYWNQLKSKSPSLIDVDDIYHSIELKKEIVQQDPFEKNERKKLNFGHTVGHALEGFLLGTNKQITHGHAVAIGMLCESHLSFKKGLLSEQVYEEIAEVIKEKYKQISINEGDYPSLISLIKNDKKNHQNQIKCVLLKAIGNAVIDIELKEEEILACFSKLLN
jgi:3-dehydroquinate synthase